MPTWSDDMVEHFLTRDRFGAEMTRIYLKRQQQKDDADAAPSSRGARHLHELAHLVRRGTGASYEDALNYLMHDRNGRTLATTFKRYCDAGGVAHGKESPMEYPMMPERRMVLKGMVKAHGGLDGLARDIVKRGSSDLSEHEMHDLILVEAKRAMPELSDAQAFSKMFESSELLRRAHQVCQYNKSEDDSSDLDAAFDSDPRRGYRQRSKTPEDADDDAQKDRTERLDGIYDEDDDAYEQLREKAVELRKRDPALSEAQSFAKAYQLYPALAQRERRQNRPFQAR
jgi:hypothetical protein